MITKELSISYIKKRVMLFIHDTIGKIPVFVAFCEDDPENLVSIGFAFSESIDVVFNDDDAGTLSTELDASIEITMFRDLSKNKISTLRQIESYIKEHFELREQELDTKLGAMIFVSVKKKGAMESE